MRTYTARPADVERKWHVVDADGQTLGRLATHVAELLRGKHKPIFTPHLDTGDFVIVVNATKIRVTGRKPAQKMYYRHSGYPGGLRSETLAQVMAARPTRVIEHAVKGMLPKGPLGRALFRKLKVYAGPTHPHESQIVGQSQPKKEPKVAGETAPAGEVTPEMAVAVESSAEAQRPNEEA